MQCFTAIPHLPTSSWIHFRTVWPISCFPVGWRRIPVWSPFAKSTSDWAFCTQKTADFPADSKSRSLDWMNSALFSECILCTHFTRAWRYSSFNTRIESPGSHKKEYSHLFFLQVIVIRKRKIKHWVLTTSSKTLGKKTQVEFLIFFS